jgi:hypothetical protein
MKHFLIGVSRLVRRCARHLATNHRLAGDLNQCLSSSCSSGRKTALVSKECNFIRDETRSGAKELILHCVLNLAALFRLSTHIRCIPYPRHVNDQPDHMTKYKNNKNQPLLLQVVSSHLFGLHDNSLFLIRRFIRTVLSSSSHIRRQVNQRVYDHFA